MSNEGQGTMTAETTSNGFSAPQAASPEENWEARFKGLQRAYNELKSNYDAQLAISAGLKRDLEAISQERESAIRGNQEKIVELNAQLTAISSERELLTQKLGQMEKEVAETRRQREVETLILGDPELRDIHEFYQKGLVNIGDATGDALKEKLMTFKEMLGSRSSEAVKKTLSGATPAISLGGKEREMNLEELSEWLANPVNESSTEYTAMREAYFNAVRQRG